MGPAPGYGLIAAWSTRVERRKVVGEPVVSHRHAATLYDPVEEPAHGVVGAVIMIDKSQGQYQRSRRSAG